MKLIVPYFFTDLNEEGDPRDEDAVGRIRDAGDAPSNAEGDDDVAPDEATYA